MSFTKPLTGEALRAYYEGVPMEIRQDLDASLFTYLCADRLSNYGYDLKDWRRLQGQRRRVKQHLYRHGRIGLTRKACDLGGSRLGYVPDRGWEYIVGQSQNEEITNLIATLVGYKKTAWLA